MKIEEGGLALIYSRAEGLRLEMPRDGMPVALEGALLAGVYVRLQKDEIWAEELRRWVAQELPSMPIQ
jgi:hypothetical protein